MKPQKHRLHLWSAKQAELKRNLRFWAVKEPALKFRWNTCSYFRLSDKENLDSIKNNEGYLFIYLIIFFRFIFFASSALPAWLDLVICLREKNQSGISANQDSCHGGGPCRQLAWKQVSVSASSRLKVQLQHTPLPKCIPDGEKQKKSGFSQWSSVSWSMYPGNMASSRILSQRGFSSACTSLSVHL